jgi:hypothetical protein
VDSVEGGDTVSAAGDGSSASVVPVAASALPLSPRSSSCAGTADASVPRCSGASAGSGSLAISSLGGVVVAEGVLGLTVSAPSCDGADEPLGVPAAPVVGMPAAAALCELQNTSANWSRVTHTSSTQSSCVRTRVRPFVAEDGRARNQRVRNTLSLPEMSERRSCHTSSRASLALVEPQPPYGGGFCFLGYRLVVAHSPAMTRARIKCAA